MGDKRLGKRARRDVSEKLRAYHNAVIRMVEPDSEAFFERVMQRASAEQVIGSTHQRESANLA